MIEIRKTPHADTRSCDVTRATKEAVQLETIYHIQDVGKVLGFFSEKLQKAAQEHDADKLSKFDWFWANFRTNFKERDWLENHYRINRHHLNAEGGVPADINLLDVMEFIADCTTAGVARHGSVTELTLPAELLVAAFKNTVAQTMSQLRLVPEYHTANYDTRIPAQVPSEESVAAENTVDAGETALTVSATTFATTDVPSEAQEPLTVVEVAQLLDCATGTVSEWAKDGLFKARKYKGRWWFDREDFFKKLAEGFQIKNTGLRAKRNSKKRDALQGKLWDEPLANGTLVFAGKEADSKLPQDFVVGFICGHSNADAYMVSEKGRPDVIDFYKFVEPLTVAEADKMLVFMRDAFMPHENFLARMRRVRPNQPVTPKQFPGNNVKK